MREIKDFAVGARKQHYLNTCFLKHSNKNISKRSIKPFFKSRYTVVNRMTFKLMHSKMGVTVLV